jgi:inward rectifier potassium channel
LRYDLLMSALEQPPMEARQTSTDRAAESDLGFGTLVARESRKRFLNRDGTFNVRREGLSFWQSQSSYHYLLTIGWGKFLAYFIVWYVVANFLFACAYFLCGPLALTHGETSVGARFAQDFFFSVHTLATIGYGNVAPVSIAANVLVTIEALMGLLTFALIAGLVFARFSRPMPRIAFSEQGVIAPYRDITAFMFRIVNQRSSELVDVAAKVLLIRRRKDGSHSDREFLQLRLERDRVAFFPLSWTVVHPIDEQSPLFGLTEADLRLCDTEFLILLDAFDETSAQTVHARSSYKGDEVLFGAKFATMFNPPSEDGVLSVDIRKLHDVERVKV